MKIALAQINPTVGALNSNAEKVLTYAHMALKSGAELVVFPELCLCGYPPKDLLSRAHFIQDNLACLEYVAKSFPDIAGIVGYVDIASSGSSTTLANAAALISGSRVFSRHFKTLLPTYDVFDEWRYFRPASHRSVASLQIGSSLVRLGISICEDIWNQEHFWGRSLYDCDPQDDLMSQGADILINISASPFSIGKPQTRADLFRAVARKYARPVIVVNQVGGNDSLIFDGGSLACNANGRIVAAARSFQEDLLVVDTEDATAEEAVYPAQSEMESLWSALTLGIRDYLQKTGFSKVVIGASGGIDSALVASLAVDALGAENVTCVAMPSEFSSPGSLADAQQLAHNLSVELIVVPITECFRAYTNTLSETFSGLDSDVTEENLQARVRGNLLMALSNKFGWIVLSTGNKSELAVGYCTLYGDMAGGLAAISDVPKTTVYRLSRYINETWQSQGRKPPIPESTLTKAPSAELRPNQKDSDSIPEYDVLDPILHAYVEREISPEEIIREGYPADQVWRVVRLVDQNEYKRQQAAPGLKVTSRAFGFGRRLPIAATFSRFSLPQKF